MKVLFRVDGGKGVGMGHLVRAQAMGAALMDHGFKAHLLTRVSDLSEATQKNLSSCFVVHNQAEAAGSQEDLMSTHLLAQHLKADWLWVDSYKGGVFLSLKAMPYKLAYISDFNSESLPNVNLIINPNLFGEKQSYLSHSLPRAKILAGASAALFRPEFLQARLEPFYIRPTVETALLSLGGADTGNYLDFVMSKIWPVLKKKNILLKVLLGPENPYTESLKQAFAHEKIQWINSTLDMPKLLMEIDLLIGAAGVLASEAGVLGVPSILMTTASNQNQVAQSFSEKKLAVLLGDAASFSPDSFASILEMILPEEFRRNISLRAKHHFDGTGVSRAMAALLETNCFLRPARREDSKLVFHWSNDDQVREQAFSSEKISWESHQQWFESKIKDKDCSFFIAEDIENGPVGQLRLDKRGELGTITINVDASKRGAGYGKSMLADLVRVARNRLGLGRLGAFALEANLASQKLFTDSGFKKLGLKEINKKSAMQFEMDLN